MLADGAEGKTINFLSIPTTGTEAKQNTGANTKICEPASSVMIEDERKDSLDDA